jgi:hypothetical protein
MSHHVTSSPDFSIRSFETPAETEAFFRLNAQAFRPDEDTELVAAHRQRFVTDDPHFHSTQLRGAFLNRTCVGGYILFERTLCLGPSHLLTLLQSLLPLWREYWQQRPRTMDWTGTLGLTIDDDRCFLEVGPIDLQLVSDPSFSPQSVRLTRQMFTQLIFGFRPLSWVMAQPGQHMPTDLLPLFEVLFPLSRAWVAGTDFF